MLVIPEGKSESPDSKTHTFTKNFSSDLQVWQTLKNAESNVMYNYIYSNSVPLDNELEIH